MRIQHMKKRLVPIILTLIVLAGGTAGAYFWLTSSGEKASEFDMRRKDEQTDQTEAHSFRFDTDHTAIELKREGPDQNVLNFEEPDSFSLTTVQSARDRLDRLIRRKTPTFEEPIIAYDPFGTVPDSYYFYFTTPNRCMVRYTVMVEDESINDHIRYVLSGNAGNTATEHEFAIAGLVPGVNNYILIELLDEKGAHREEVTYKVSVPRVEGVPSKIDYIRGHSEEKMTTGLFFLMPKKDKLIYLYDNNGVMRGRLMTESGHGKRVYLSEKYILYQVSPTKIVQVNKIGQPEGVAMVNGYGEILDFVYDNYENVCALVKSKGRYMIVRTSVKGGKTRKVYTFDKGMKPASIAYASGGNLYVAVTGPDGILRIDGVMSAKPKVGVVFGIKEHWKKTSLKKRVSDPTKKKKAKEEETKDDVEAATGSAAGETQEQEQEKYVPIRGWDMKHSILYRVEGESSGNTDVLSFAVEKNNTILAETVSIDNKNREIRVSSEKETDVQGELLITRDGTHTIVTNLNRGIFEERDDMFKETRVYSFIRELEGMWKIDMSGFCFY